MDPEIAERIASSLERIEEHLESIREHGIDIDQANDTKLRVVVTDS